MVKKQTGKQTKKRKQARNESPMSTTRNRTIFAIILWKCGNSSLYTEFPQFFYDVYFLKNNIYTFRF